MVVSFLYQGLVPRHTHCPPMSETDFIVEPRATERILRTRREAGDYLLQTYATGDVPAETDATLPRNNQPPTMSPTQYAEALVIKRLRCEKT